MLATASENFKIGNMSVVELLEDLLGVAAIDKNRISGHGPSSHKKRPATDSRSLASIPCRQPQRITGGYVTIFIIGKVPHKFKGKNPQKKKNLQKAAITCNRRQQTAFSCNNHPYRTPPRRIKNTTLPTVLQKKRIVKQKDAYTQEFREAARGPRPGLD